MNKKKVVTIIVTYNGEQWIEKCINCLLTSNYPTDIYIADNGSSDATISILTKFKTLHIIENTENLGFGKANNIAIEKAMKNKYDYYLLVNQDVYLYRNTLSTLVSFSNNNKNFGIISPLHYNQSGKQLDNNFKHYLTKSINKNTHYEVGFINAASWLISKECIGKVGLFHPIFYHYGEDRNYCDRAIFFKFKIGVVKKTKIIHDRIQNESMEKALKYCHLKLVTLAVNPNFNFIQSFYKIIVNILGIGNYYFKKYKSTKFYYVLLKRGILVLSNFRKFQSLKIQMRSKNYWLKLE